MNEPIKAVLIIWICVIAGIITVIMAAVSLTDPLCKPCSYSPQFKGNLMPISSIIVAFFWRSDGTWTHSCFVSRLFHICSWGVREEALDAHPPEQWAGGTGDAVSLQPAGPTDQSSGPSGETLTLMLRSLNTVLVFSLIQVSNLN